MTRVADAAARPRAGAAKVWGGRGALVSRPGDRKDECFGREFALRAVVFLRAFRLVALHSGLSGSLLGLAASEGGREFTDACRQRPVLKPAAGGRPSIGLPRSPEVTPLGLRKPCRRRCSRPEPDPLDHGPAPFGRVDPDALPVDGVGQEHAGGLRGRGEVYLSPSLSPLFRTRSSRRTPGPGEAREPLRVSRGQPEPLTALRSGSRRSPG